MSAMDKVGGSFAEEVFVQDTPSDTETPERGFRPVEWYRNLPIGSKLRAVFGSFVAILLVLTAVMTFGFSQLLERYDVNMSLNDAAFEAGQLRAKSGDIRYEAMLYTLEADGSSADVVTEDIGEARAMIAQIRSIVAANDASFTPDVDALDSQLTAYEGKFAAVGQSLAETGRSAQTTRRAYELSAAGDSLYAQTLNMQQKLIETVEFRSTNGLGYFFNLTWIVLFLAAAAAATIYFGLRFLSRDLSGKVGEIAGAMNMLSKGETDFHIDGQDRKDEIGSMVRTLDVFKVGTARLKEAAAEREARAKADIKVEEDRVRERSEQQQKHMEMLGKLANSFEQTVGDIANNVASASSQLKSTAGTMANAAEQSSRQTGDVARSMQEASSGATAAAAASDEFAMSIGEISRQAASSAELARNASDSAETADKTISALADSAEQVGNIVELIQSIAKRTNLLALNASIEAARGGEAGRGFAVVASEVKELAAQTSRATEEVAEQIRSMQSSTTNSVKALRTIGDQIEQLETTAISIASAVDQQSVAGQDLARSIDLAARSSDQVASSIESVRETSLATGTAASQVLSSATELEGQAAELSSQVGAFLRQVRAG